MEFNWLDLKKVLKQVVIVGLAAGLTYLSSQIPGLHLGVSGEIIMGALTILLKFLERLIFNNSINLEAGKIGN